MRDEKKIFQDLSPRRSLRDIAPQGTKRSSSFARPKAPTPATKINKNGRYEGYIDLNDDYDEGGIGSIFVKIIWAIVVIAVLFGAYYLASFFRVATVEIGVRSANKTVNDSIFITQDARTVATKDASLSIIVSADKEDEVLSKATGKITVFNEQTASHALIINTRFQTDDGKIYRITSPITVPAAKNGVPGKKEVEVRADPDSNSDERWKEYNIPAGTKLVVSTYKENKSNLLTKIYAETATAISGGEKGIKRIASAIAVENASAQLDKDLEEQLLREVSQLENLILLDYKIVYSTVNSDNDKDSSGIKISKSADINAVLVKKDSLAKLLAGKIIPGYNGEKIEIANFDQIKIKSKIAKDSIAPDMDNFDLGVEGDVFLVYLFNEQDLKESIAGKNKDDAEKSLASFPIALRGIKISPFLYSKIPSNLDKIIVTEE
jgi:hypothetical protein